MVFASDWLAFHADRTPEKLAVIDQHTGRHLTYGELSARVGRLAYALQTRWGAQEGDRLAILAKNCMEYFEFQFACARLGAMMLPLNWRLTNAELAFILNDAEAKGLLYDATFSAQVPDLLARTTLAHTLRLDYGQAPVDDALSYDDALAQAQGEAVMPPHLTHDTPMTIMYTAGTTGSPKGVLITHGMTFWNMTNISTPAVLSANSVHYVVLPLFHTGGLNLYANPIFHEGGTNIIAREFDPALTLQTLTDPDLGVTHFFGVPSIYLFLSQHPDFARADLRHIQSWGCGGAPMPAALLKAYADKGLIVQLGFGMTETSPTVFLIDKRRALEKPTSVGKPLLHTRVRVVDEDLRDVKPHQVGEVLVGGPNVTIGYWRREDANAKSFIVDEHGTRWIRSGDAGTVDEEGCVYIVDRYKDMYISGGENVYPAEVEQVIFSMEGVADVGVIGIPHERWGETGMAFVVKKQDATLDEAGIIAYCRERLAKFKVPSRVVFTDALPRNAAGKILKRTLREQVSGEQLAIKD